MINLIFQIRDDLVEFEGVELFLKWVENLFGLGFVMRLKTVKYLMGVGKSVWMVVEWFALVISGHFDDGLFVHA